MKKLFILLAMLTFSTFVMAQAPVNGHTKPYNEAKEILESVKDGIQSAKDCDELDMAVFGVIALFGVEDIDEITESEEDLFTKLTDEIDKILENKKAALNCKDDEDDWGDDDDDDW